MPNDCRCGEQRCLFLPFSLRSHPNISLDGLEAATGMKGESCVPLRRRHDTSAFERQVELVFAMLEAQEQRRAGAFRSNTT